MPVASWSVDLAHSRRLLSPFASSAARREWDSYGEGLLLSFVEAGLEGGGLVLRGGRDSLVTESFGIIQNVL